MLERLRTRGGIVCRTFAEVYAWFERIGHRIRHVRGARRDVHFFIVPSRLPAPIVLAAADHPDGGLCIVTVLGGLEPHTWSEQPRRHVTRAAPTRRNPRRRRHQEPPALDDD